MVHLLLLFFQLEKELKLGTSAYQVVLWLMRFVVGIAIDVIGEETNGLHIGEQSTTIRQQLYLYRC